MAGKGGRILRSLAVTVGLVVGLMLSTRSSWATLITITSTVRQSGMDQNPRQNGGIHKLTDNRSPFDFTGQDYASLSSIDTIEITLTMHDGDSAWGEFDHNDLTLGLGGFDTGIKLNDFRNNANVRQTISGTPNNIADILSSLQAEGKLAGTVIDADPADIQGGGAGHGRDQFGNKIGFPAVYTTLRITGPNQSQSSGGGDGNEGGGNVESIPIPEPSTIVLIGIGALGLLACRRRRQK